MTVNRPNAVIYQENATLTTTPSIPDLPVLVVGPAYQLLDYLDDKDECYATEYGAYQEDCVVTPPTAVVISAPPGLIAGGLLESANTKIFFDEAEVVITESAADDTYGVYTSGDNLFAGHTAGVGSHFGVAEVAPGDVLIVDDSAGSSHIMTIKELCYTLVASGANFTGANPVQPGDTVTIALDTRTTPKRNGDYTVKRVLSATALEVTTATWEGTALGQTGTLSVVDSAGSPRITPLVATSLVDYCNLRTTEDFTESAVLGDNRNWRIERLVNDIELDSTTDFSVSGNTVTVISGVTVDLSLTLLNKAVTYAKIYMEYAALRTDLQRLIELNDTSEMDASPVLLGKYDARNPLRVGVAVAKANTTTPVLIYGVPGNTLADYTEFLERISTERNIYTIVPLTLNTSILAMLKNSCEELADPNTALSRGIKQKFRVCIGALELLTTKELSPATGGATPSVKTTTAPSGNKTGTLTITGGTPPDFFACGVLPGDVFEIHDAAPVPTTTSYVIAQVNDHLVFESETAITNATFSVAGDYTRVTRAGVLVAGTLSTVGAGGVTDVAIGATALDDLYLILSVPTATFLTDGCIPGDILQIPDNPTVNSWTATPKSFVIDEVISNQKVRIVNNGNNTALLENELPHGGRRTDGTEITGTQYCRVIRYMTKTQQVNDLVATAQSFASSRQLVCYPNRVDPTDLVDGSLARITDPLGIDPEPAAPQPGYYLACAVGGQTAGKPPHQGFTNVGIAGIDRIYDSSDYFSEEQLTTLSNGGVYVFTQATTNALPASIHEVTTDVSTLEFSEYMVVKDFDFVAWTFLDTLLPFIGPWNVTAETIEFVRQAVVSTADNLKARKVSKIGSPLLSYTLSSVGQSDLSRDRIEAFLLVSLPMTLNTIGLHLVA